MMVHKRKRNLIARSSTLSIPNAKKFRNVITPKKTTVGGFYGDALHMTDYSGVDNLALFSWAELTGQPKGNLNANTNYIANTPSTRLVVTLPSACEVGDVIRVVGKGAAGWRLKPDGSQTIILGNVTSATGTDGGYIESGYLTDSVALVCTTENSVWTVFSCKALTTLTIQPAWVNTYSVLFDGVDERIEAANNTIHQIGTGDYSISLWVKLGDVTGNQILCSKGGWAFQQEGFSFYASGALFSGQVRDSSNNVVTMGGNTSIFSGTWYHVVMTIDQTVDQLVRLYINSNEETNTGNMNSVGADLDGTSTWCLGARNGETGPADRFLNGNIDEVIVAKGHCFTQAEITELYNSGSPANPEDHSAFANMTAYYRMGDDDNDDETTMIDQIGSNNLTGVNLEAGDIEADTP